MKCYFCQTELKIDGRCVDLRHPYYSPCETCFVLHGVGVYTVNGLKNNRLLQSRDDGELLYAHIYIDERSFIQMPGFLSSLTFASGNYYHIRLHLREGYTLVSDSGEEEGHDLLKLPGFPIKPENAKQKLKLYLLFS